ncbi:enoyl-CoA hydratase/isomerase family protein [Desulfoprunum benzoelyticum]|uniref:enoyl-CoA hydratase n=1 Tax=Desulfoprunum benzoelyticum TaxID=1506996 RepID=A0A840UUE7_9BACT|nr:3-hydroxyacyl-CoA dehydrogenase/enoyl-CoA hydratase family protein [Desulfoprunum benzoelyticum]MBB5349412.1 enoyl-CoA hydratase/3-hydroxyacyl-CoA dehydrogenase [Desulfoprunum benzoelyticum]MBM9531196.1 enoyl-CoA hydratase/isomerase family protein [Desulfoprunum benzoelyticum]
MKQLAKIGVIGAGNMGSGIVQKIAQEGLSVVMVDTNEEFVQKGLANIKSLLQAGVERKIFSPSQMAATLSRITATADLNQVADADLIIEAVFEDKDVKTALFQRLDAICSQHTILATNTSSFYVREFAEKINRPDRFVGLHYFYHPAKNRLLEVIPHQGTSPETVETAKMFARLHGKTAITVKDAPGFAVNRYFVPFLNEAARMLEENLANIPTIEAAAKHAFKIGMGAFELMNVTGIPIAVHSADTLGRELGPFYATSAILRNQMEKKENWDLSGQVDESKLEKVEDRFLGVCLGVAAALVDEGVASVEDTDLGAKVGLRWAKGPFEIINRIGIAKTCQVVEALALKYADFAVPEILKSHKQTGKPFEFRWVDLKVKDQIAYITINRPEAMNALNEAVVRQLEEKFSEAESNPDIKGIAIQGAGKAFVAGADIRYFINNIKKDRIDDTVAFTRGGHELLLRIENSTKRTIAVLDGLSLGGGSELALACQVIVATSAGSMGFPETAIGIFPGLGGMIRTARQIGTELAKYYVFTGRTITAQDALDLGIVSKIVNPQDLEKTVLEICNGPKPDKYRSRKHPERFVELAKVCSPDNVKALLAGLKPEGVADDLAEKTLKIISRKAPLALLLVDRLIDAQQKVSIPEAIELELAELNHIFSTEDALAGLSSVGGKPPQYQGK